MEGQPKNIIPPGSWLSSVWRHNNNIKVLFHHKNDYQNFTMPKLSNTPTWPLKKHSKRLSIALHLLNKGAQRLITHALISNILMWTRKLLTVCKSELIYSHKRNINATYRISLWNKGHFLKKHPTNHQAIQVKLGVRIEEEAHCDCALWFVIWTILINFTWLEVNLCSNSRKAFSLSLATFIPPHLCFSFLFSVS